MSYLSEAQDWQYYAKDRGTNTEDEMKLSKQRLINYLCVCVCVFFFFKSFSFIGVKACDKHGYSQKKKKVKM